MRFLVDAQLPPALAVHLEKAGHEAEHVNRIKLGEAPDAAVWAHAVSTNAVLITKDADFLTLAHQSDQASAIVWVRVGNMSNAALVRIVQTALPEIIMAIEAGARLVEVR